MFHDVVERFLKDSINVNLIFPAKKGINFLHSKRNSDVIMLHEIVKQPFQGI